MTLGSGDLPAKDFGTHQVQISGEGGVLVSRSCAPPVADKSGNGNYFANNGAQ